MACHSVSVVAAARAVPIGGPLHFSSNAAAIVYGCVSMSTRPEPWVSSALEIATWNVAIPDTTVYLRKLTQKNPAMRK